MLSVWASYPRSEARPFPYPTPTEDAALPIFISCHHTSRTWLAGRSLWPGSYQTPKHATWILPSSFVGGQPSLYLFSLEHPTLWDMVGTILLI